MANLGDLKSRIILETVRDDLADDLAAGLNQVIASAIDDYEYERWWFNESVTTVPCVPGVPSIPYPSIARRIDTIRCQIGGVRYAMTMRDLDWIEAAYSTPQSGQPTDWAPYLQTVQLWPTPNQAYPLLLELVIQVQPALDYTVNTSSNTWTNEGADLIVARAKKRLYRDYLSATLQDTRVINANNQEEEAYSRLRSQSTRRLSTDRVAPSW
jgi:hypothetical protein